MKLDFWHYLGAGGAGKSLGLLVKEVKNNKS